MIASTVQFALLAAAFAALTITWLKRLPTLHLCPTCTHRTQAVLLPRWLRPLQRWIGLRWCPDCEWEGIGRRGPEFIPGRPLAHDSGFHWGANIIGRNAGFHWAELVPPEPCDPSAQPPAHRSGFRFGGTPTPSKPRVHPSGFSWSDPRPAVPHVDRCDSHSEFPWGSRRREAEIFQWGQAPRRRPLH